MTSVVTAREITVFLTVIGVWARQNKTSWYPIIASLKTCLNFRGCEIRGFEARVPLLRHRLNSNPLFSQPLRQKVMAGFNTGSILPLIFNLVLLVEVAI